MHMSESTVHLTEPSVDRALEGFESPIDLDEGAFQVRQTRF